MLAKKEKKKDAGSSELMSGLGWRTPGLIYPGQHLAQAATSCPPWWAEPAFLVQRDCMAVSNDREGLSPDDALGTGWE